MLINKTWRKRETEKRRSYLREGKENCDIEFLQEKIKKLSFHIPWVHGEWDEGVNGGKLVTTN